MRKCLETLGDFNKKLIAMGNVFFIGATLSLMSLFIGCTQHLATPMIAAYEDLWHACDRSITQYGFVPKLYQRDAGYWESEWQIRLYPLRPGGYRRKVTMQLTPLLAPTLSNLARKLAQEYQVQLQIVREINTSPHDFMSEKHAIWAPDGYDVAEENTLLEAIAAKLVVGD